MPPKGNAKLLGAMACLLICGAHPDDETYFAGSMAKYVAQGVRDCVLCATRGERGNTADLCSIPELPQLREAELRRSMRVLGLQDEDVFFLPYQDQKLHLADLDEIRAQIVSIIRQVRPEVVVTFDPHGANGHTDHVAISRFVSDAVPAASDDRFCTDSGPVWTVRRLLWQPAHLPWSLPKGTDVRRCFGTDFLIDTSAHAEKKRQAISEHKSQLPGLMHLFTPGGNTELTLDQEVFRLACGPRPCVTPCGDLFEGFDES